MTDRSEVDFGAARIRHRWKSERKPPVSPHPHGVHFALALRGNAVKYDGAGGERAVPEEDAAREHRVGQDLRTGGLRAQDEKEDDGESDRRRPDLRD